MQIHESTISHHGDDIRKELDVPPSAFFFAFFITRADSCHSHQLAIISQGIAARYARRQASSEAAHIHVSLFPVFGQLAIKVLEDEGISIESKAKL